MLILRSELMERYPLVDEFAVIDSGSQDKTLEVAGNYGADTYLASDILPEVGDKRGKGENLWKAIHQLKGDIICYVDADITNIHPRFVYGLVAPLINRDEIQYVKAFYDRPLNYSSGLRPSGGGRVTEILTRPLFSLFYPELTNVIQPYRVNMPLAAKFGNNPLPYWIWSRDFSLTRPLCKIWTGSLWADGSGPSGSP